jgi:hypothetical protein
MPRLGTALGTLWNDEISVSLHDAKAPGAWVSRHHTPNGANAVVAGPASHTPTLRRRDAEAGAPGLLSGEVAITTKSRPSANDQCGRARPHIVAASVLAGARRLRDRPRDKGEINDEIDASPNPERCPPAAGMMRAWS